MEKKKLRRISFSSTRTHLRLLNLKDVFFLIFEQKIRSKNSVISIQRKKVYLGPIPWISPGYCVPRPNSNRANRPIELAVESRWIATRRRTNKMESVENQELIRFLTTTTTVLDANWVPIKLSPSDKWRLHRGESCCFVLQSWSLGNQRKRSSDSDWNSHQVDDFVEEMIQ